MSLHTHVKKLVDEMRDLATRRVADGWDAYWRNCMKYALPSDVSYDSLLSGGSVGQITQVLSQPTAQRLSKDLYDQTSLWAIERLTAGMLTLKTPESTNWHGLGVDEVFGLEHEPTHEEQAWFDRVSRYLFSVRSNPFTGFWPSHKGAIRSATALGDGVLFVEETFGDNRAPWRYSFVPLGECYVSMTAHGTMLRFFRVRSMTAEQMYEKWGDRVSTKVANAAKDASKKNDRFEVMHVVTPREGLDRVGKMGIAGAPLAGGYIETEENHLIQETGYWEMPYIKHSWNSSYNRPYSEGPLAIALGEIKSLNEMAKNELISSQQAVRPPLATFGDNFTRINLNAGKVNPNLMTGDGKMLVQPIMTHTRPDFAQSVLESRRGMVRETLYLNLWQILIQKPDMTATEALLRSQEKGELLGPVGISFNRSLAFMVEREIAILARKGAFNEGSPLAAPESIADSNISPIFTAPLDRMRKMDEVVGAQRTVAGMLEVAAFEPTIMKKLNVDAYAEHLRKGHGAPADMFFDEDTMKEQQASEEQQNQLAQTLELAKAGGEAASAMGAGAQQLSGGAGGGTGPAPDIASAVAA